MIEIVTLFLYLCMNYSVLASFFSDIFRIVVVSRKNLIKVLSL